MRKFILEIAAITLKSLKEEDLTYTELCRLIAIIGGKSRIRAILWKLTDQAFFEKETSAMKEFDVESGWRKIESGIAEKSEGEPDEQQKKAANSDTINPEIDFPHSKTDNAGNSCIAIESTVLQHSFKNDTIELYVQSEAEDESTREMAKSDIDILMKLYFSCRQTDDKYDTISLKRAELPIRSNSLRNNFEDIVGFLFYLNDDDKVSLSLINWESYDQSSPFAPDRYSSPKPDFVTRVQYSYEPV